MSTDKSHQLVIREAIRKIALGRSMERVNMAPGGMSGHSPPVRSLYAGSPEKITAP